MSELDDVWRAIEVKTVGIINTLRSVPTFLKFFKFEDPVSALTDDHTRLKIYLVPFIVRHTLHRGPRRRASHVHRALCIIGCLGIDIEVCSPYTSQKVAQSCDVL